MIALKKKKIQKQNKKKKSRMVIDKANNIRLKREKERSDRVSL
jgi:hypothetical protein